MAWNIPGRCDTERAAAAFLRSPALDQIKIEGEWFTRDQIITKLEQWAAPAEVKGPAPEYREMLDASDVRDL